MRRRQSLFTSLRTKGLSVTRRYVAFLFNHEETIVYGAPGNVVVVRDYDYVLPPVDDDCVGDDVD